jgi:tetracycline 7-halogenase / FADH2 O2-dependent halogenase
MHPTYDICIVGSGFAGSLLGWILAHHGLQVAIVDRARHPRFAIGESSTPLADFLLEQLADEHGLEPLRSLSRWGSWQRTLPQLRAGMKRGFSYFAHAPGSPFIESDKHERSWLVAASSDDLRSDTHWMRSDVDQWFCNQARAAGADVFEATSINNITASTNVPSGPAWHLQLLPPASENRRDVFHKSNLSDSRRLQARFLIDASGGGGVLGQSFGLSRLDAQLRVRTAALFGHFRQVKAMRDWQVEHHLHFANDPFNPDDAAQHHLLEHGWCWMLRFSEGTTSVGFASPELSHPALAEPRNRWQRWLHYLERYPTLKDLLEHAQLVAPENGELGWLPRISRLWSQAAGIDSSTGLAWAMLPGTVGIVDPLHSTGIAHGLWGVRQMARLLIDGTAEKWSSTATRHLLAAYSQATVAEVQWIDRMVAAAYASLQHFPLFQAACGIYFASAIHSERQLAGTQTLPDGWLLKDNQHLQQIVSRLLEALASSDPASRDSQAALELDQRLRKQLAEWDDVGLFDPQSRNRVARSAAPKS